MRRRGQNGRRYLFLRPPRLSGKGLSVLILGCGFTGRRVASLVSARGLNVTGLRSSDIDFTKPGSVQSLQALIQPGSLILHSVPTLPGHADALLVNAFENLPKRVVYLSTTSVYGASEIVNEHTPPSPRTEREQARRATEERVRSGPWQSLILRPAAIYGPGRGIQTSMRQGRYRLQGDGSNYVSRIHVDDLAAITAAALLSDLQGEFPVADDEPCTAIEIATYCADLLGLPLPPSEDPTELPESLRANRRVDGSAIRKLLAVTLRYPSYRTGIPASL